MTVSRLADVIEAAGYRPRGIVHVGAHKGQEADRYLSLGTELIVWVEGDPDRLPSLNKVVRRSPPSTRQLIICSLITERDGALVDFQRYANKGLSSSIFGPTELLLSDYPGVVPTGEVLQLTSSRLDTALSAAGVTPDQVDVMAFDIQGAELVALQGAGAYLKGVEFIECEVSEALLYAGAPLAHEVEAFLREAGFRRITKMRRHGDVVFRRDHGAP
jgi:FkbM family methyltransferase